MVAGSARQRQHAETFLPASKGTATNERAGASDPKLEAESVRLSRPGRFSVRQRPTGYTFANLKRDISLIAIGLLRAASTLSSSCN